MTAKIDYIWQDDQGNVRINADLAFIDLYPKISDDTSVNVININEVSNHLSNSLKRLALTKFGKEPSSGSLNNCKGRWNEFSFLYSAHMSILKSTDSIYLVKLGNESSLKFWEIYSRKSRERFESLILELKKHKIFIRCSTPDFVLIRREILQKIPDAKESRFFEDLKILYKQLINNCEPSDVISFISLKTSNRPDRRYQILYEANITKYASRYIHNSGIPLRYDAIGNSNDSDTEVFSAPLLCDLKIIDVENLDKELLSVTYPIIDSDINIYTNQDMDNYWKRFNH